MPTALDRSRPGRTRGERAGWRRRTPLVPTISFYAAPSPQGFYVDARLSVDNEGTGIVWFILLWIFFFPAAIVLAVLAYNDANARLQQLQQMLWAPVSHLLIAPNYPPAFGQQPFGPGR